ncbi:hypothetical protein ACKKBF_B01340 [Auxenochlorella protothecoides x Auxenochlorella symbiontica]|uniref:Apyrase n=1 Tax=Auxenochlorella protothecoides TaxID=3075 RepID=A0A1D1ZWQ8_AUXPR
MGKGREGRWDLVRRHRVLLTVLSIPVVLVLLVLGIMPRASPLDPRYGASKAADASTQQAKFSVVIDAGSTGSRVHIFKFLTSAAGAQDLQFDKFEQLKPGLSSYAADPKAAAASLKPLLALALETIPEALHAQTHVSVGATAGLRMLPGTKADEILAEVRALLKTYPFQSAASDVSILTGVNEGAFAWLTLNYLLGRLGEHEDRTVAAIDLGGGSVQEAFAMTAEEAAGAPHANYTTTLSGGGRRYSVYVYSYLGYGLMAGRAGVLAAPADPAAPHPCVPVGYAGEYEYAGVKHPMRGGEAGSAAACAAVAASSLNAALECAAPQLQCSFNGAWGGGRVPSVFYISSYFWDRAVDAGLVPETAAIEARVKPAEFKKLADKACSAKLADLGTLFPNVQEAARPFFCMDLCYVHTLLLEGFRVPEETEVTIVKKVQYKKEQVEAAWPLGAAINSLG